MSTGFDLMKRLTLGAVAIEETERGAVFHRFTPEQFAVYQNDALNEKSSSAPTGGQPRFPASH